MVSSLSVVVPARDARPWIGELIESVLNQDVADLELLVLDNGSKDGTAELVEQFATADGRVRLVRSDALCAASARNEGVAAADGTYLVFADADDIVPDGAYSAMIASLEASGSDMVIGDHLKFSSTATWSPTKRWYGFEDSRVAVAPVDVPALYSGRACWNRMIRRTFWDRVGLRFPEISSVDDIEPMTRAFVSAQQIDVVPQTVYLYRDRNDRSSISQHADAATTVRYLTQELRCADLVAAHPSLVAQHRLTVLDADGWAHMSRFLAASPTPDDVASVRAALHTLLEVLPLDDLHDVAPDRRLLWALMISGRWEAASEFARSTSAERTDPSRRLIAWTAAVTALREPDELPTELGPLARDGFVPALVNGADETSRDWLASVLPELRTLPVANGVDGLRAAMVDALGNGDVDAVVRVSELRRVVPLVVQYATPTEYGLDIGGSLAVGAHAVSLTLVFRSGSQVADVPVQVSDGAWSASVTAAQLGAGRWTVRVRATGVAVEFSVVTARMSLPPIDAPFLIQPLADRKDGWRFLIEQRAPRSGIRSALARLRRAVR